MTMTTPGVDPGTVPVTVSSAIAEVITTRTGHVFGLMGNGNAHLVSHLTAAGFPFTSARHESATVAMADAYYRATGLVGVATTTYGAGFTNTYTALAEARLARIPLVLVVGDAPTTGSRSFDIDQVGASTAVGVTTLTVSIDDAFAMTHRAFELAILTFQPVVLAVPYDLANSPLSECSITEAVPLPAKPVWAPPAEDLDRIAEIIQGAKRPLILAGRGVLLDHASEALTALGDRIGALYMTSVMATNIIDSPWNLGIAGGFTRAHRLVIAQQADVVLVAGASLNSFQTRYGTLFGDGAQIIRIDNELEIPNPQVTVYLRSDLRHGLTELTRRIRQVEGPKTWRASSPEVATDVFRSADPVEDSAEFGSDGRLNPRAVVAELEDILPAERSVVMDGGHFMGWAPMYLTVPDPYAMVLVGTAFQSIGLGFGSAAGVSAARPDRTTVFITGDGGGLMGLADMETFLRTTRRGVVVVLNDSAYGAELHQYAAKGLDATAMLIDEVDFAAVGRALGAYGAKVKSLADLAVLSDWLATHDQGVFVLDVAISQKVIVEFMSAALSAAG